MIKNLPLNQNVSSFQLLFIKIQRNPWRLGFDRIHDHDICLIYMYYNNSSHQQFHQHDQGFFLCLFVLFCFVLFFKTNIIYILVFKSLLKFPSLIKFNLLQILYICCQMLWMFKHLDEWCDLRKPPKPRGKNPSHGAKFIFWDDWYHMKVWISSFQLDLLWSKVTTDVQRLQK